MSLEEQKVFQSNKTAEEGEIERRKKKRPDDRARCARRKNATKAEDSRKKTPEEKLEFLREKNREYVRTCMARKKESPEVWEAFKEKERARDRVRYAKMKEARDAKMKEARDAEMEEARKRVCKPLVVNELKDLASDRIKIIDNTLEGEEAKDRYAKRIKEACKKAKAFGLRESKWALMRSKTLKDEQIKRNRIKSMKELESYLERKAEIERKLPNSVINSANPAEQKSETDPSEGDSSKNEIAVCNKKQSAEESEIEKRDYAIRRKARKEQQNLKRSNNKKKVALIKPCRLKEPMRDLFRNELERYLEKKAQYLFNNCATPAERNCETNPFEGEKSMQPVTLQMEVEVEPQQIEESLLTYVKKEIEPLMPCIDEVHSQPVKIKTEPGELQPLLPYVRTELSHLIPRIEDEHFQPVKIKTEPEEL